MNHTRSQIIVILLVIILTISGCIGSKSGANTDTGKKQQVDNAIAPVNEPPSTPTPIQKGGLYEWAVVDKFTISIESYTATYFTYKKGNTYFVTTIMPTANTKEAKDFYLPWKKEISAAEMFDSGGDAAFIYYSREVDQLFGGAYKGNTFFATQYGYELSSASDGTPLLSYAHTKNDIMTDKEQLKALTKELLAQYAEGK